MADRPTLAPSYAPTWDEQRNELRLTHAGCNIVITTDEADCTLVDIRPDPVSTPPLAVFVSNQPVHDAMPHGAEWQAKADALRDTKARAAQKRQLIQAARAKLPPNATEAQVMDAMAEAALG